MKAIDDKDLMLGFLDGNEDAFNELYGRYDDDVRNVIYRYAPACLKGEIGATDNSRDFQNFLIECFVELAA